ncbi:fungal hydrophobin-domain-containing protein [Armillaria mellea]|nr:fungal hydrophobin-domain-containing protein [Armillaria mellea]
MFTRISSAALLALPLLVNAGVIHVVLPRDEGTDITGRQVVTVSPTICPLIPRDESDDGTDIEGRQVITLSPVICPVLPRDESDDSSIIAGRQVITISPVISAPLVPLPALPILPALPVLPTLPSGLPTLPVLPSLPVLPTLPRDESDEHTILTNKQAITDSPTAISPVLTRGGGGGGGGAACSATGTAQCCDSTESPSDLSPSVATLLGSLGVVVSDLTADVGVTCSPISVIGVGGTSCSSQTVCCDDNHFNGLVALGCTPINVGL